MVRRRLRAQEAARGSELAPLRQTTGEQIKRVVAARNAMQQLREVLWQSSRAVEPEAPEMELVDGQSGANGSSSERAAKGAPDDAPQDGDSSSDE